LVPNLGIIWDALSLHFNAFAEYAARIALACRKIIENQFNKDDCLKTVKLLQRSEVDNMKHFFKWAATFWEMDHSEKTKCAKKQQNDRLRGHALSAQCVGAGRGRISPGLAARKDEGGQ
jgi:hypothetical protein